MKSSIYLFEPGILRRKNHSLAFEAFKKADDEYHPGERIGKELAEIYPFESEDGWWYGTPKRFPVERIDSIFVFTNLRLNAALIHFLSQKGIVVHFFNYYGSYTSSLLNQNTNSNGVILEKQVLAMSDHKERLNLAQLIVKGASHNMKRLLRYYSNRTGDDSYERFKTDAAHTKIEEAVSLDELMGFEGAVRRHYYHHLDGYLLDALKLEGRSYRPPRNAANALLSLLNMMLYSTILQEVIKTQLHPAIGCLHTAGRQRYPMVYDLAELFRPLLSEQLLVSLIRKRIIQPDDFDPSLKQICLTREGKYKVSRAFESRLRTTIFCDTLKRSVSYRYLIRMEIYKIIKHLLGEKKYETFKLEW